MMTHLSVKKNRAESFSPIYKDYKNYFNPILEFDNFFSQVKAPQKLRIIHCNSLFAEETVNIIINYFNEQSRLDANFKNCILNEINTIKFAFANDESKLQAIVETNADDSFTSSANGMTLILDAFIKYSDFENNLSHNYFEDIDYTDEETIVKYDAHKNWLAQTINEPWFEKV